MSRAREAKRALIHSAWRRQEMARLLPPTLLPPMLESLPERRIRDANAFIAATLRHGKPAMVGRLGSIELSRLVSLRRYRDESGDIIQFTKKLSKLPFSTKWKIRREEAFRGEMQDDARNALRFLEEYELAMDEVDLLGSWAFGETFFEDRLRSTNLCALGDLDPFGLDDPWSQELRGLRVVVVHPFRASIESQYRNAREKIFPGTDTLPKFNLRVVQAFLEGVRDADDGASGFFSMRDNLLEEIHAKPFDVAIIGSGPNGFLLAAEIKRRGGIGIHLGGVTQLLFGIKGRRWESQGFSLSNEHWIRPLPSDTPNNYRQILDGGAYW